MNDIEDLSEINVPAQWKLEYPNGDINRMEGRILVKKSQDFFVGHHCYDSFLLQENFERLEEIAMLKDGWDGCGAKRIGDSVIKRTQSVLSRIQIQPFIAPTGRNSIQLEVAKGDSDYIEMEIFDNLIISYQIMDGKEEEHSFSLEEAVKAIQIFFNAEDL